MTTARTDPPAVADEATMLLAFLDYFRDTRRRQTEGPDAGQLATRLPPSTLTLGGLLKHLASVEGFWCRFVLRGEDQHEPWASVDWRADRDWDHHSAVEDTPEQLRALLDAEVAAADAAIRAALAEGGVGTAAARERHGRRPNLRWILVHLVEEYARHCGHADLLRESVDGAVDL